METSELMGSNHKIKIHQRDSIVDLKWQRKQPANSKDAIQRAKRKVKKKLRASKTDISQYVYQKILYEKNKIREMTIKCVTCEIFRKNLNLYIYVQT